MRRILLTFTGVVWKRTRRISRGKPLYFYYSYHFNAHFKNHHTQFTPTEESNDKGISERMVGSPHQSKECHVTSTFWATTVIPHPEDGNCPPHDLPLLLGTHLELYLPALKLKQGHRQQSANFFIKSVCEYFSLCRAYVASVAINQLHPCSMTIRKPMCGCVFFKR